MTSRSPTRVSATRSRLALLFPLAVCLLLGPLVLALDEFRYDLGLVRELNERQLFDYSLLQLDLMLQRYPDNTDRVLLEKTKTLYAHGKRKLGDETIAKITKDSRYYLASRLLVGEMAYRRRDLKSSEQAYAQYFAKITAPGDDPDDVEDFKRAVRLYSRVLEEQGKGEEAAKVMGYLGRITGEEGASDRQLVFLRAQSLLAAEEKKLAEKQPISEKVVKDAMATLATLQFVLDGVAAASFVERARANVILGENQVMVQLKRGDKKTEVKAFIEAIKTLKMSSEFMMQIEETLEKGGNRANSPFAGALFYKGKALYGQAVVAFALKDDQATAQKYFKAAAKYFEATVAEYGDSQYRMQALAQHGKCSAMLEKKYGEKIEMPGGSIDAEIELKMEQAAAFLNTKNYASAAPVYLDAVRSGRRSRRLPEVGMRLVMCYAHLDRFLEAEAIVSYLADMFGKSDDTAQAALMLGGFLYESSKALKDAAQKEARIDRAMAVLDQFVSIAPTHPKAPEIAFMIAENRYRVASEIAKAAAKAPAAEREDAKARARVAYIEAVPKYQRLVDQYTSFEKGVRSLYKLGWIYYSTEQPRDAADAFLRYCELESLPNRTDDRLEAKFRAAEQLMLDEAPAEAAEHFTELLAWLAPGSDKGMDPNAKIAKRVKEDSSSYLGWSYDLAGEAFRPQITELKAQIGTAKRGTKAAEAAILTEEARHAAEEKEIETAKRQYGDLATQAEQATSELTPTAASVDVTPAAGEAPQTEEEREAAKRIAAERAARLAAEKAKQLRQRLEGEKLGYEQERRQVKEGTAAADERKDKLEQELATVDAELKQLRQEKEQLSAKLARLQADMEKARKAKADAEEEVQEFQRSLEDAKEKQASEDPKTRAEGTKERRLVALRLQAAQRNFDEAQGRLEKVVSPEAEKKVADLQVDVSDLQAKVTAVERQQQRTEKQKALAAKDSELSQARLMAVVKALEWNEQAAKILGLEGEAKAAALQVHKTITDDVMNAYRGVMEKRVERSVLMQTMARKAAAVAKQTVAEAQQQITALEDAMKPIRETFDGWKRKAEEQFSRFLTAYPASKHVPDNMARLGTIYLEFEDFAKAADVLTKLSTQYPQSNAGKEALFNLGRAQFEIGKYEEAEGVFTRLMQHKDEILSPNLSYISETMLEAGRPKVSLAASTELLARSSDPKHADYEILRERSREHAFFRGGEAAYQLGDYPRALELFAELLQERANSAYFYEAKFRMGMAMRQQDPADLDGAIRSFSEVLQYADDPPMANRALCLLAETLVMSGGEEELRLGLARFQQVVMLADPATEGNKPSIETAVYESAKAFARLGDAGKRDEMVKLYRQSFPKGRYSQDITKLPAAEFATQPAGGG